MGGVNENKPHLLVHWREVLLPHMLQEHHISNRYSQTSNQEQINHVQPLQYIYKKKQQHIDPCYNQSHPVNYVNHIHDWFSTTTPIY